MRFIAIGSSVREELKGCIAELTVSFSEHSAPPTLFPDLLHNRDVSRMLNISKRMATALSSHIPAALYPNRA